jgi:CubicO group peptidase (beta-lactamase class C family)
MKQKIQLLILLELLQLNSAKSQTWGTIDSLLSNNLSAYNGAVIVMISHGDSLVYNYTSGGYNNNTVKPIASLTKTFSAAVILKLAQEGIIHLDDSIGMYIPYATQVGKGANTIRQNFSHTAGWSGRKGNIYLSSRLLTMQQCVDRILLNDPIIFTPGTKFNYTGVSMQVAARAAEIAAGDSWNNIWTNRIKEPLGLFSTYFVNTTNPRVAGGLRSSPSDILKFAQFILKNGENSNGIQLVDRIWMQELWKDQTEGVSAVYTPNPENAAYNNPNVTETARYGLGTWLDILTPGDKSCKQITGAGAFGSIMWINRCNDTCGIVFTLSSYRKVKKISSQVIDVVNSIYSNPCQEQ